MSLGTATYAYTPLLERQSNAMYASGCDTPEFERGVESSRRLGGTTQGAESRQHHGTLLWPYSNSSSINLHMTGFWVPFLQQPH